ncbi:MAG: PfkB family carbohydrate kinase, partial [Naasia sp.]
MSEQQSPRVVVLGDVIDDVVVRPEGATAPDSDTDAAIERSAGGSGANAAVWLAAEGLAVDFVGTVGFDDLSRHGTLLGGAGVTPRLIGSSEPTGSIVVLIDGTRRNMYTSRGANRGTGPASIADEVLAAAGHLHFSGYSVFSESADEQQWNDLIDRAHSYFVTVSVDPGSVSYLERYGTARFLRAVAGADILLPNLDEGLALSRARDPHAAVETLLGLFPVVALTRGAEGAVIGHAGGGLVEVGAADLDGGIVDTTGAGDAFTAGFLAGWLDAPHAPETIRRAALRGVA